MMYIEDNNKIIITDINSFNIKETLECGQCFRFYEKEKDLYAIVAFGKVLYVKQDKNTTKLYPCTLEEFLNIWINYFDLERDYCEIKKDLIKNDKIMEMAIDYAKGIRILNQDPFECLISFIISQNNRIPMIKKVIENISNTYGNAIIDTEYKAFPSINTLNCATIEDIQLLKTGFRAKYIKDALIKLESGNLCLTSLKDAHTTIAKEQLMTIFGVGEKVADCVLLFSLGKYDVFPTDVWVKRVMEHFYFDGIPQNIKVIHEFATNKWRDNMGFAQQYLFNYAKAMQIGKK